MKKNWMLFGIIGLVVLTMVVALSMSLSGKSAGKKKASFGGGIIAVVRMEGIISGGGEGGVSLLGGSTVGSTTLMETLRQVGEDDRVKVLVLRINSPGGAVTATEEVGKEIDRLKAKGIKVVTSMGDAAASGGYYLAAKSDYIMANSSTLTGSIGVIMDLTNTEEFYNKIGYKSVPIKSGPYKDIGSSSRPMTSEERQIIQGMVDESYNQFVKTVADGRKLPVEQVKAIADGRVLTGSQALNLKLVDGLGNYYDALAKAAELAGLPVDAPVEEYGQTDPFSSFLSNMQGIGLGNQNILTSGELQLLKEMLRSRSIQ